MKKNYAAVGEVWEKQIITVLSGTIGRVWILLKLSKDSKNVEYLHSRGNLS